ncbi:hypothetical protein EVU96_09090 [Bacillus infantis]|uniref:hypothetical protein n=1 Tax=Bacillus infantis TaxID=324767 RepID=UPI00101D4B26|nr:hypothetical protein [Bacillus infantis]RYI30560.1 hypothetical protein EVU96_09090 [Bacillus infantis]
MECKACGHKHNVWNAEELKNEHTETEAFYRIEGKFELVKGWDRSNETLYVCPNCGTVKIEL